MAVKKILIFISIGFLFLNFPLVFAEENNPRAVIKKRKDLGVVQKQIQECQNKKQRARKKEKVVSKELKKIDKTLKARKKELAVYKWNLKKNKEETELLISSLSAQIDKRQQMRDCLIDNIRMRSKRILPAQLFVFPADLGEMVIHSALENKVNSRVISMIEEREKEIDRKKAEREELGKYRELELTYKKAAQKKEKKAKGLEKKKKQLLTRYQREKKKQDKRLKELREEALSLEKLIGRLEKNQRVRRGFRGGYFRKRKGSLPKPAEGRLAKARYGNSSDIYKGIMVKAPRGRAVISVSNGKVMYSDWFRGFGNIIIIDHGSGYSTLYAHLDEILVKSEEEVSEGQVIARVGSSGSLTREPRLYFEIRRHGESLNPLSWLER